MERTTTWSRRAERGVVVAAVCTLAQIAGAGESLKQSPPGAAASAPKPALVSADPVAGVRASLVKARVPRALVSHAQALGARLVADYGSFAVVEGTLDTVNAVGAGGVAEVLPLENLILLNAGPIDTTPGGGGAGGGAGAKVEARAKFEGKAMHLVQFAGPIKPEWLSALERTGVRIVTYIPSNAYLVYGDFDQISALQKRAATGAIPSVQWNGEYKPEYRLAPSAKALVDDPAKSAVTDQLFSIQLVKDEQANKQTLDLLDQIRTGERIGEYDALDYHNVVAPVPPGVLAALAAQPDVVSIHAYTLPKKFDERQNQIISGNLAGTVPSGPGYLAWLGTKGFTQEQFTASNFAVDVSDSGVDNGSTSPNHMGLYLTGARPGTSRIIYNRLVGTAHAGSTLQGCDGHGNLNTHIVMGYNNLTGSPFADAAGYRYGLGVCPFVKAGSSVVFDPNTFTSPNYNNLQSMAYNDGARISTNSWGGTSNAYISDCQTYDALVRDAQPSGSSFPVAGNQPMVIVFAAGNAGSAAGTVGEPSTAKNVITVGASENVQAFGGSDGCGTTDSEANSALDIATFSSRGPCADGRKKPDIVAPGTHVSGGVAQTASPGVTGTGNACYVGTGVCGGVGSIYFPAGQQFYTASSGTSHSTPAVAGACALVRQFFLNMSLAAPSPAMTKAILMNSTRYMTGTGANDTLWSNSQGMGLMNLGELFNRGTVPTLLRDQVAADTFTATGQTRTFVGTVADSSKPFRITLAWTDAPGATSGSAWKNDLDLTVTVGANTYKGNVFSAASSVTGGAADAANNVESVFLPAGVTGAVTITVTASNINSDGVPNSGGSLDQDFALVGYNVTTTPIVVLSATGADSFADNVGNGNANGRIDPGETEIQVFAPVTNSGTLNATGVTGTLVSNTPTVTVTSAVAAYPNLAAGGSTAGNLTPYVLSVSPSHPCGAPISLTLSVTSNQASAAPHAIDLSTGSSGAGGVQTFSYSGPAVAIPDNNATGISVPLSVSGMTGTISDVNFRLNGTSCTSTAGATTVGLDHSRVGNLVLTLVSPTGSSVVLMNRPGGTGNTGNNFCNTVLDDSAASGIQSILASGNPWTGTFAPNAPLAAFNGQNPNGTWTLKVQDLAANGTGNLRAFSLVVTTAVPVTCDPPAVVSVCPSVTLDPTDASACPGGGATFHVEATGNPAPAFLWRRNTVPIDTAMNPSAATDTLSLSNVGPADAGSYDCVVTNVCGDDTSVAAMLTLDSAPSILSSPVSGSVCKGGSKSLSFGASGSEPVERRWQWREVGEASFRDVTPGANSVDGVQPARFSASVVDEASIDLTNISVGLDLEFRGEALNPCGAAPSDAAVIHVCAADYDCAGGVNVADLFAFLDAWFAQFGGPAGDPSADFDGDANVTVADLFGFLDVWFLEFGNCGV